MKRILLCLAIMSVFASFSTFAKSYSKYSYYDDDDYEDDYEDDYDDDYDDEYDDNDDYYDEDQSKHEKNDEVTYVYNTTQAGDQMIKIGVGLTIPQGFGNPLPGKKGTMKLGGIASLGYHYFMTDWFAVGVDVGFGFNSTISDRMFNWVPIIATATVQPSIKNIEFPISVGVGLAWETYSSKTYWPGLVLKAEAGIHYKINRGWSVGADVSYTVLPQLGELWKNGGNEYGKFVTVSACVHYYF